MIWPLAIHAQGLPVLAKAQEITIGSFPNGAPYYIVKNGRQKGYADFALVRIGQEKPGQLRRSLVSLPHFINRRPYDFLAENGIGYGSHGFIQSIEGGQILNLENVPIYRQEVQDSTLLMLFDIMALSRDPQAVIISGDVDVAKIKERAELFSMIVAPLSSEQPSLEKELAIKEGPSQYLRENFSQKLSGINLIFTSPRSEKHNRATILPLVSNKYYIQTNFLLEKRIREAFRRVKMPLADVRFRYKDSVEDSDLEHYVLSLFVPSDSLTSASHILGEVLGQMERDGASLEEFRSLRKQIPTEQLLDSDRGTNAYYVRKCLSAYLYGADLASEETKINFYNNHVLPEREELALYNNFVAVLLGQKDKLSVRYELPNAVLDTSSALNVMLESWEEEKLYLANKTGPLLLNPAHSNAKIKIGRTSTDAVTGGSIWPFSNGLRVIVKKTGNKSYFDYAFVLNGGSPTLPNIKAGESTFLSDMLGLCDIAGVPGEVFFRRLSEDGISMKVEASMTSLIISGRAPKSSIYELFSAINAISNSRRVNKEAFEYYRQCEFLREDMQALYPRNPKANLDQMLCPSYHFSSSRDASSLADDFPQRANQYFDNQFSKFNDGIILLMGDFDEEGLKKELPKYISGLNVRNINSPRPRLDYPMIVGRTSAVEESVSSTIGAAERCVSMALSSFIPFNQANYLAFWLSLEHLRSYLSGVFVDMGYYVTIEGEIEAYPRETDRLYIVCRPCHPDSVPEGVTIADPLSVLAYLREFADGMGGAIIDNQSLKAYKAKLQTDIEAERAEFDQIIYLIVKRYCEGKDLVSGWKSTLNSISADNLRTVLESLSAGSRAEYVIL